MTPDFVADGIQIYHADCRKVLRSLPDNSIDSVVTDPPYALVFMGKGWDTGDTAHSLEFWQECLRVLKPGGHVVAFAGTRTYHRLACAIEDAGFEIRDQLQWLYGSGFPKSHDVSKGIDRAAGAIGVQSQGFNVAGNDDRKAKLKQNLSFRADYGYKFSPATESAKEWQGWGTALKPANEPICLARKPLSEKTVAANVLRWETGAINVDGCRVEGEVPATTQGQSNNAGTIYGADQRTLREFKPNSLGRWPANVITDGSEEVVALFPDTGPAKAGNRGLQHSGRHGGLADIGGNLKEGTDTIRGHSDAGGSAARFFYQAKANKKDRAGSKHPTVKPIALMQWLARLVTPPGGTILDPFGGSGTTAVAAEREGFKVILCEREDEYIQDIIRRLDFMPIGDPRLSVNG